MGDHPRQPVRPHRHGATVVLRGVNVAAGSNLALQSRVVELGANLVRIHVAWADLQPRAPAAGDPGWNTALIATHADSRSRGTGRTRSTC